MDAHSSVWHSQAVPRDPRYRSFRMARWALYLGVVALALIVVLTSVVHHLRGPHRPAPTGALPTRAALRVCVTELEGLGREQNERVWKFADEVGEGDAVARWDLWARAWEQRVDDLSDRCRLAAAGSKQLQTFPAPRRSCKIRLQVRFPV